MQNPGMTTLEYRNAGLNDCQFVYELRTLKDDKYKYEKTVSTYKKHKSFWRKYYESYRIISYENAVIGYFGLVEEDFRIAIVENYRGRGIGSKVIEDNKKLLKNKIIKIASHNKQSIRIFEKNGFYKTREESRFIFMELLEL